MNSYRVLAVAAVGFAVGISKQVWKETFKDALVIVSLAAVFGVMTFVASAASTILYVRRLL